MRIIELPKTYGKMKPKFFFDYIYYRLNKFYFKWDGRSGITSIIGLTMIQVLILAGIVGFIMRKLYDRNQTTHYVETGKWIMLIVYVMLMLYNFKLYANKYNKLRFYWKDETKNTRILKGTLVILSLVVPWVVVIMIGVLM